MSPVSFIWPRRLISNISGPDVCLAPTHFSQTNLFRPGKNSRPYKQDWRTRLCCVYHYFMKDKYVKAAKFDLQLISFFQGTIILSGHSAFHLKHWYLLDNNVRKLFNLKFSVKYWNGWAAQDLRAFWAFFLLRTFFKE